MRTAALLLCLASALFLLSCASLTVSNVDYAWPVEAPVTVSHTNSITIERYGLTCNLSKVAEKEFQDSTALAGAQVRILRNNEGYYFLTGPRFKHVYVFRAATSELIAEHIFDITTTGLQNPALNQRPPYIELVDTGGIHKLLTSSDIVEGNSK